MAKYDLAFKLTTVHAYLNGEGGYKYLSKNFNIPSTSTLRKWVKVYKEFGQSGLERH